MAVHYHWGAFPPAELDWPQLIPLLGPAAAAVARYDGTLAAMPNAAVWLSPLTTQEAVLSSRIEGTQATMGEVLQLEAAGDSPELSEERRNDIREALNYRAALRVAEKMLAELPLSQRVIREAHRVLLAGVRGQAQAEENQQKASAILDWYERMKREVADLTRSQYAIHALDWIFERPIFKSSDFAAMSHKRGRQGVWA